MNALCGLLTVAAVIGTGIAGRIAGTPVACRCGHSRAHHQHHRAGTDCALCAETTSPCRRYRRRWWHQTPAGGEPPSPPPLRRQAPLPGPVLRAGGKLTLTRRIITDFGQCGCAITHDSGRPRELDVDPCREHAFDLAEWEARLPQ